MEVVEHEHEHLVLREHLQQLAHGAMAAVALVLDCPVLVRRGREERREDERELGPHVVGELVQPLRLEPFDVLLDRVDEDPEGHVLLELRRRPGEDELPAPSASAASSASSRVLPMPGSPTSTTRRLSTEPSSDARPTRWVASAICRFWLHPRSGPADREIRVAQPG